MRISTGMIYDNALASMQNRTSGLLKSQQQISAGRRMLTPADDPVAAARALEVTQAQAVNNSQATTRNNVKSTLGIIDGQLDSASTLMQRVRELSVQSGNAALAASDRQSIATELRARFQEMVALANNRDGNGLYLFGGYQTNNQPFSGSVENGVVYRGDDGARSLRVSGSRDLQISDSGNNVFMNIKNGNGVFATATQQEKSTNSTTASIDALQVTNAAAWADPVNSGDLKLNFWVDAAGTIGTAGLTYYDLVDANGASLYTNGTSTAGGSGNTFTRAYTSGATINLSGFNAAYNNPSAANAPDFGASVLVRGQPASGDSFAITRPAATVAATPAVTDPLAWDDAVNSGDLQVRFWVDATNALGGGVGAKYYDLVDATANKSLLTNAAPSNGATAGMLAYTSGAAIPFSGLNAAFNNPNATPAGSPDFGATVTVTGTPANGDRVDVLKTGLIAPFGISATPRSGQAASAVIQATSTQARAMMDQGTVSDPIKWAQTANSGNLEVRFWVDSQGGVTTAGQTVGNVVIPPNLTVGAAANQFSIALDGGAAQNITVTAGTYLTPTAFVAQLQTDIDAVVGAGNVTASLDVDNHLVLTSTTSGTPSNVALAAWTDTGLSALFGTPQTTPGITGAAGATYYDLVDGTTGKSLFNGATSTAGGGSNTYLHPYTSGATISLSSPGGPGQTSFDFGASVKVTNSPAGGPASGDTFTIKSDDAYYGNGTFVTAAKMAAAVNAGGGVVGVGEVVDISKWNQPANSRNLEVRFWSDPDTVPPELYYDLVDTVTEKSLFSDSTSTTGGTGNTYTHKFKAGDAIPFTGLNVPDAGPPPTTVTDFGIRLSVTGTPQSGDVFKVQASQSVSVFDTMAKLINTLESGAPPGTAGNTQLSNELAGVLANVSQIEDNFLKVRASIGSRLAEVEDLDSVGQDLDLQYNQTLSGLQDLDYADAITQLMRQQTELQAAQNSFARISQLSLFDYLK